MPNIHTVPAAVKHSRSFTLPIFTAPPEFAPTWEHPAEQLAAILGQFPRAERRVIDIVRGWLTRPGGPAYLTLGRKWLAREAKCCKATVSRAFARARETGLLDIEERYRLSGNLWRQISNLIRLPLRRPQRRLPEVRKSSTQTRKQRKRTLNKVAYGTFEDKTGILAKWKSRGPAAPGAESG